MVRYLSEPRRRFHQPPAAVLLPRDVGAVQQIARFASANRIGLIPQGGNTGLVGGQVPQRGDEVIVNLSRLDRIRDIDAAAGVVTAEAGVTLQAAQQAAEAHGTMLPLWIASQGSAQIGGVLSSNAGGVQVLAYGNARTLCLGIEAVLADGRLYQGLSALKRTIPVTTSRTCWSAPKARWASSPPPPCGCTRSRKASRRRSSTSRHPKSPCNCSTPCATAAAPNSRRSS